MKPTVGDGAAFGTKQPCPARWIATLRHQHVALGLFCPDPTRAVDGEELDRAPNGTQRLNLVEHFGRDGLSRTSFQLDVNRRRSRSRKAQPSALDDDPPPGARRDTVGSAQTGRHCSLVPDRASPHPTQPLGQFGPIAERTVQGCPQPIEPPAGVEHPGSDLKWGPVVDVLVVPARQLGHPVANLVLVVAGDRSLHGPSVVILGWHRWPAVNRRVRPSGGSSPTVVVTDHREAVTLPT